jgi:hypothetical protein
MKKIFKTVGFLIATISLVTFSSCETTNLDLTENPNELPLSASNPDLLLNGVQLKFAQTIQYFGNSGAEVTRLKYMFGRDYQNAYSASFFNTEWEYSYRSILKNIRLMNPIAEEKGLKKHIAIGQVLEAYTMVTLVDYFGDVPYSEALDGTNLNPKLDAGKDVYAAALVLLDKAIVNFNATATADPKIDFYYNKSWAKWIKLANTVKMKIYIQTKNVDATAISKFNSLVSAGSFIGAGEDFEFKWGTSNANPDSRHPEYINNYTPSGVGSGYQSNWLMNEMRNGKSIVDPRTRFYFYRQVNDTPVSEQDMTCTVQPAPAHYLAGGHVYCRIANNAGYWGRDHGNNEGTPPDSQKRTAAGLYPAGGRFDDNSFRAINSITLGAAGQGITPIILASTVDFWRAEAALSTGGTGDAKALMLAGITKSLAKVRGFLSLDKGANLSGVTITSDASYLTEVGTLYDNATTKLDVVMTEFFITLYGNGVDAYNAYRRTGLPSRLQPNIEANPGKFIRSFLYPASETGSNPNVKQKVSVGQRVFWDNNPETGFPLAN